MSFKIWSKKSRLWECHSLLMKPSNPWQVAQVMVKDLKVQDIKPLLFTWGINVLLWSNHSRQNIVTPSWRMRLLLVVSTKPSPLLLLKILQDSPRDPWSLRKYNVILPDEFWKQRLIIRFNTFRFCLIAIDLVDVTATHSGSPTPSKIHAVEHEIEGEKPNKKKLRLKKITKQLWAKVRIEELEKKIENHEDHSNSNNQRWLN